MSTTIDQKVVEMRFDNKHFESNVKETLSTLEKLKQRLNLTGASKGLENIGHVANKVDMSGINNAVDTVRSKFSALEVMGITALANLTNSAVNAGKRMVKALTIDPVMDGFREYEMTLNAIQTTMAGTGKTAKEVEEQLKRLDDYADKTVYSTSDMLNNLPKFTNAGVDLEKATTAMIGIANATALAGGDAGKASIAFYNLGQAIGTGYLTRMDYNSINNAGIATMEWKEQMVEAAIAAGTLKKANDGLYKAGKKTFTIQQLFIDGLQEQWATTDVMMKVFEDYGNETTEIGKKAYSSAQDIKTFSMMMDSLKATAGTGWKDTWQIIFGDLEKAKEFWTGLTNFISNIINGMAEARNAILNSILGKSFVGLFEGIRKSADSVKGAVETVKNYTDIVNEIIRGDWGNGKTRFDKLTKAGYDWAHAQNLVNEKLGNSKRHATNYKEAQEGIAKNQEKINESTADYIVELTEKSDAELKSLGYTKEQIKAFRDLESASRKTGIPLKELIENIDEIDGRYLIINTFKNLGASLVSIFTSLGTAFKDAFSFPTDSIFNVIAGMHKLSVIIRDKVERNADSLTRTLKGLFAILDIIKTFIFGPISIAVKVIFTTFTTILEACNLNLLDFTAIIGDAIVKVRDWIEEHNIFTKGIEKLVYFIKSMVGNIKYWLSNNEQLSKTLSNIKTMISKIIEKGKQWIKDNLTLNNVLSKIKSALEILGEKIKNWTSENEFLSKSLDVIKSAIDTVSDKIKKWIDSFKDVNNIPKHIIEGLANGITNGAKTVIEAVINLGKRILEGICKVLGIESPSTEFFEIGRNIILGLVNGIKEGASKVIDALKNIFDNFDIDFNWNGMASIINFITSLIPGLSKLNIGANFARMMSSVGVDSMRGLLDGLKDGFFKVIEFIKEIAIKMLDGICGILGIHSPSTAFFDIGRNIIQGLINGLQNGVQAVFNFIKNIGAKCVELFKKIDFGKLFAAGLGVGILIISKQMLGVIDNVANAASKIASIPENLTAPFKGLGDLLSGLGGSLKDFAKGYKAAGQAQIIKSAAIALAVLAGSVFLLSKIEPKTLWATIGAVTALTGVVVALGFAMAAIAKTGSVADSAKSFLTGTVIASIGASLIMIALTMKILGSIDPGKYVSVLLGLTGAVVALGLLFKAIGKSLTGVDLKNIHKVGTMIKKIAWALLLMVVVIKLASMLKPEDLFNGVIVVGALGLLIKGLGLISKDGKDADKIGKMISKISFALLIMIGVIKLASMLSMDEIGRGITLIAAVGLLFAGLIKVSQFAGKHGATAGKMLLEISTALLIMVAVVKLASMINKDELWKAVGAVSVLGVLVAGLIAVSKFAGKEAIKAGAMILEISMALLIITGVLFILSKMNAQDLLPALGIVAVLEALFAGLIFVSKYAQNCMGNIIAITVAISILVAAIVGLSFIDPDKLKNVMTNISIMMAALALLVKATGMAGDWKSVLKTGLVLLSIVGILGLVAFGLSKLNTDLSMDNIKALITMLLGMSASLVIISRMGPTAITGVGALALLGLVVGELAVILGLMSHFDVNPSIETAKALSTLLLAMSGALVILGVVGAMGPAAFIGIGALATLITGIGGLIVGIGALFDKFPMLEEFLDKGIPILEKIGYALGSFVGNVLGGLATGLTSGLPEIGTNLSDFMTNANVFIQGAKQIDETVINGISTLAKAIIALTAADIINGISSFLSGGSSFANLGTELSNFMINALPFIVGAKMIDPAVAEGVKSLADTILILTKADVINGLTSWFTGGASIAEFGKQLAEFGPYVAQYASSVAGINPETVVASANAAKALSEMAAAIPNMGGLVSFFSGDNKISTFGAHLVVFGQYLKAYSVEVTGINHEAISLSVTAAKSLSKMAEDIPNMGGLVSFFAGDNKISDFGAQLVLFGDFLKTYSIMVAGINHEAISLSVTATKALSKMADEIPNMGGLVSFFSGDNKLSDFGANLTLFGGSLKSYSASVSGLDHTAISASVLAAKSLADLSKGIADVDFDGLSGFAKSLNKVGIDSVDKFVQAFKNGTTKASEGVQTLLKAALGVFVKNMTEFTTSGENTMNSFTKGVNKTSTNLLITFRSIILSCINVINGQYYSFVTAGGYLGDGLISGINAKQESVYWAAYALGQKAVQGEKDGQQSNSPSKATIKAGNWFGEGLVIGIQQMGSKVYKAGHEMGNNAVSSISGAISRVSDVINSDIDTQPTIRPVLDLSDVESGAGYLSSMFNNGPSVGVMSNIRAISSGMNNRNQNGTNNDVVSAIDKLRKDLGNTSGNTYNVNGITYDDGSKIATAVEEIIRAVIVEGRV